MYEALVARVRYHIQKANFMGLKDAESTLLLKETADAIEELSKPRWIPVTEKLPDEHESVLVYNPQYQITVGYIYGGGQFRVRAVLFPETPTYWMPLPLPPEEGNQ